MLEARDIAARGEEIIAVILRRDVATDLAQIRRAQAQAGGAERRVGCRSAGGDGQTGAAELSDELNNILVIDEDHAALVASDMGRQERFRNLGQQIHDGIADADQVKRRIGHGKEKLKLGRNDGRVRSTAVCSADDQVGGEDRFIIDLDQNRIFPRLIETLIAEFVDEINAVQGALGFEFAVEELARISGIQAHRHLDHVFPWLNIRQR